MNDGEFLGCQQSNCLQTLAVEFADPKFTGFADRIVPKKSLQSVIDDSAGVRWSENLNRQSIPAPGLSQYFVKSGKVIEMEMRKEQRAAVPEICPC